MPMFSFMEFMLLSIAAITLQIWLHLRILRWGDCPGFSAREYVVISVFCKREIRRSESEICSTDQGGRPEDAGRCPSSKGLKLRHTGSPQKLEKTKIQILTKSPEGAQPSWHLEFRSCDSRKRIHFCWLLEATVLVLLYHGSHRRPK